MGWACLCDIQIADPHIEAHFQLGLGTGNGELVRADQEDRVQEPCELGGGAGGCGLAGEHEWAAFILTDHQWSNSGRGQHWIR